MSDPVSPRIGRVLGWTLGSLVLLICALVAIGTTIVSRHYGREQAADRRQQVVARSELRTHVDRFADSVAAMSHYSDPTPEPLRSLTKSNGFELQWWSSDRGTFTFFMLAKQQYTGALGTRSVGECYLIAINGVGTDQAWASVEDRPTCSPPELITTTA